MQIAQRMIMGLAVIGCVVAPCVSACGGGTRRVG
jgi:hypothetical protein